MKENNKEKKPKEKKKFTKKEKIQIAIILSAIAIAVIVVIIVMINNSYKYRKNTIMKDGIEINTSANISKDKEVNGLVIENMQIKRENGVCDIYADIVNKSNEKKGSFEVFISILDEQSNPITGFGYKLPLLEVGESKTLKIASKTDFVNAYDCTIQKIR